MQHIKPQASAKDPGTNVRLPTELMRYIDEQAERNGRSRNTEIVVRLRSTMEREQAA